MRMPRFLAEVTAVALLCCSTVLVAEEGPTKLLRQPALIHSCDMIRGGLRDRRLVDVAGDGALDEAFYFIHHDV